MRDTTKAIPSGGEAGAPKPDPTVSPDVINKAVERAANELWPEFSGVKNPRPGSRSDKHLTRVIEAAAPVLLGAGREQEQARLRDEVAALRANAPAWPDDDSYEAGLDAALASLDEEGTSE